MQHEIVNSFIYLKCKTTSNSKSTLNIKCRIAQAKQMFFNKKKLFVIITINVNVRKTPTKTVIWRVALYYRIMNNTES